MNSLILAAVWLGYTPLPHTQADVNEALAHAASVTPDDLRTTGFASTDISKRGLDEGKVVFLFEGRYPIEAGSGGVGRQRVLNCEITRVALDVSKTCTVTEHRMMAFGGIDQPIELDVGVAESDARRVLQYLAERVGTLVEEHELLEWEFRRIEQVSVSDSPAGAPNFALTYLSGGECSSYWILVQGERHDAELKLGTVSRSRSVC